jgi:outer membrane lipopolysaccharide assembly protein LptE/RlpB
MMQRKLLPLLSLILLLIMACGFGSSSLDAMSMTVTPLSERVRETITARAGEQSGSGDELATAVAKATAKSEEIYATQTARAALNEPARLATATAQAPVVAELPRYGIDPASGYTAWLHKPAVIDLNGFGQTGFANDYPQITAKDFVMAADITWNTKNSLSGCGFMFRSNGDTKKPSQYMTLITRTATGHMAWLALMNGQVSNFREYYPKDQDKSFNWFNDSTNRLAIVVRGDLIDMYTNGTLIGEVNIKEGPPDITLKQPKIVIPDNVLPGQLEQFQQAANEQDQGNNQVKAQLNDARKNFAINKPFLYDGLLGFLGASDSGHTICTFQNAWLFILNQ